MLRLRVIALLAVIFLATIFSSPIFADAVLSIDPASSTVSTGTTFAVNVNISAVSDLYDYQFDLEFNPLLVQATGILEGSFLSSGGTTFFIPGTIDNTAGSITFNADTLLTAISGVSGSGTLVQIDFTAIAPGTSGITLPDNADLILQDSTGGVINTTTTNGSVTVQGATPVPEPSGLSLLAAGLLLLALVCFKKVAIWGGR